MESRQENPAGLEGGAMTGGTGSSANAGTTAVRSGYELDDRALLAWLETNVEGFTGPLRTSSLHRRGAMSYAANPRVS